MSAPLLFIYAGGGVVRCRSWCDIAVSFVYLFLRRVFDLVFALRPGADAPVLKICHGSDSSNTALGEDVEYEPRIDRHETERARTDISKQTCFLIQERQHYTTTNNNTTATNSLGVLLLYIHIAIEPRITHRGCGGAHISVTRLANSLLRSLLWGGLASTGDRFHYAKGAAVAEV